MRKIILLVVVVALIAAGWFFYFSGDDDALSVGVTKAEFRDLSNTLEFSGEVVPKRMYSVMSPIGGQISRIYVNEGSTVSKGDELILLDTSNIEMELKRARLTYELLEQAQTQVVMAQPSVMQASIAEQKAKVALALSQTTGYDFASFNEAFGADIEEGAKQMANSLEGMQMSDITDLTNATQTAATDISGELAMAQMAIKSLENALEQMSVVSEIDGTVIMLSVNEGEVLAPGIPAMVIADTQSTLISAYVYEKDVGDLIHGMDVRIDGELGYYVGTLSKIGTAAVGIGDASLFDTMTKVEITPDERFSRMPGAVVDLEITVSKKDDVLSLPMDCFTKDNCVFVVGEDGIVQNRTVVIGFRDTYYAQVVSGVQVGETVVISPKNLSEGQYVEYDRSE